MSVENPDSGRYWCGVVSRTHIAIGNEGGFIQLNHGKRTPLARLHAGDGLVIYSPRTSYPEGAPLQAFTAIGTVKDERIYQVDMGDGFVPYRRDIRYFPCGEAPIKYLIGDLSFIKNKTHWGMYFRFGLLRIPEEDFRLIAEKMGCGAGVLSGN